MKVKKVDREKREKYCFTLKPSLKAKGDKIAFKRNVSMSRLIENFINNLAQVELKND